MGLASSDEAGALHVVDACGVSGPTGMAPKRFLLQTHGGKFLRP